MKTNPSMKCFLRNNSIKLIIDAVYITERKCRRSRLALSLEWLSICLKLIYNYLYFELRNQKVTYVSSDINSMNFILGQTTILCLSVTSTPVSSHGTVLCIQHRDTCLLYALMKQIRLKIIQIRYRSTNVVSFHSILQDKSNLNFSLF